MDGAGQVSRRTSPCGIEVSARTAHYLAASSWNEYTVRAGHALLSDRRQFTKPRDRITKAGTVLYSATADCNCTGLPDEATVPEHSTAASRQRARALQGCRASDCRDAAAMQSRRDRKKVEIVRASQAHPRRGPIAPGRRGLTGAHDLLAAIPEPATNGQEVDRRTTVRSRCQPERRSRTLATPAISAAPLVTRSPPMKRRLENSSQTEFFNGISW